MLNDQIEDRKRKIKSLIENLINDNELDEAKKNIELYEKVVKDDIDICSMKSVIAIIEGKLNEAENILKDGLKIDSSNFDLNYNLAYVYKQLQNYSQAYKYYKISLDQCSDENIKKQINNEIENILIEHNEEIKEEKKKIAFFVKQGLDSFLDDIINGLSDEYETKKIIVTQYKQIEEGMNWADICWFEWCDELISYGSRLSIATDKKIICRLHSYEAFTDYPSAVNWNNIDKIIFVAKHIRDFVIDKFKIKYYKTIVIPNGVDINNYTFKERSHGFNIAYAGYINYKKGPMLLLHTFKAFYEKDKRYKLYIAGTFQDERYVLYFNHIIKELGLEKNIFYQGWQNNIDEWLEDKNYILCTSILESQNISVMQAMAKGIKPIIHNFVGAKNIYDSKYVFNTINEAVNIAHSDYDSYEYRNYIEKFYSKYNIIKIIKKTIEDLLIFTK